MSGSSIQRIIRFKKDGQIFWGDYDLSLDLVYHINGSIYENWERGKIAGSLNSLEILPPCEPRVVVGLAYNYRDLVGKSESYAEPLLFLKTPNTVISSMDSILIPKHSVKTWVEVEIAIVVRRNIFNADYREASDAILGVTICNDVTSLNVSNRDHHLAKSKSLPTFCPIGDYVSIGQSTENLLMTTEINGKKTQNSNSNERILNEVESVMLISKHIPLSPGDLVLTGTPAGAMESLIEPGDFATLNIQGLGSLSNKIEVSG